MTMTGARQTVSLMLSSLFARWRSLSPANDKTAYERSSIAFSTHAKTSLPLCGSKLVCSGKVPGGFDHPQSPVVLRPTELRYLSDG
jgi:hypothetical protein